MDADRQRIEEDLRGTLAGEVRCDDLFVQLYANDASIYELKPLGVVRPRTLADIVATVQYAAENNIPLQARGAGTGLAGESLGHGLIIDFSRYFRRILWSDNDRVRVQAGVVLASLNRHLAREYRLFGPDPANGQVTTMGSVVAVDAGGSHWLRYGSARRHVESLQCVLADGQVVELHRHPRVEPHSPDTSPRLRQLVDSVAGLIHRNGRVIAEHRPTSLVNRSGYILHDVVENGTVNLGRLMAGSEGTLGLVTEVTLTTDPLPKHRGCVLLVFDSLEKAIQAALEIRSLNPSACDLMDRRHLSLARETDVRYELLIPAEAESVLLIEQDAESTTELQEKLDEIVEVAQYRSGLAVASHISRDGGDVDLFWQLARRFVPTLYRLKGSARPIPCIEDVALRPEALPVFLKHLQDILKHLDVTACMFGHVGHGQLHIRPFLDLANEDDVHRMESLASAVYEKVWLLGGTISGEHGDGLSRTPFLARQYGPLVNVFRELKQVFDPHHILNPGKIVADPNARMTHHLRALLRREAPANGADVATNGQSAKPRTVELQLQWHADEMAHVARACNGCGACRSLAPDVRMCPIFRFAPREEASPRAKANLARSILTGSLADEQLLEDACKEIADLCVHCHMCRLECPANVDIPKLMMEVKATYVQTNGLSMADWFMTRVDTLSALASRLPGIANWALTNPPARWLMEKTLGIAQGRKLPRLARRSFLRQATMRRLHRSVKSADEKVLFFVDTYANYHDTQLADALVKVLRYNGVAVFVPSEQCQSAMAMISQGELEGARRIAEMNVALLAEHVRLGYTIVSTEPSAVLALTQEYPIILDDDEDALLVAGNAQEACHYLWRLHQRGRLKLDFKPQRISVGYHVPCHMRALGVGTPAENLLRLVPGLRLTRVEKGCSGMAGTYGMKRENYRNSLRAGWDLITAVRDGAFQIGMTECSTCKMQMEQGTTKPTVHPIKLLALAYGLMPEIEQLVQSHGRSLVVT